MTRIRFTVFLCVKKYIAFARYMENHAMCSGIILEKEGVYINCTTGRDTARNVKEQKGE